MDDFKIGDIVILANYKIQEYERMMPESDGWFRGAFTLTDWKDMNVCVEEWKTYSKNRVIFYDVCRGVKDDYIPTLMPIPYWQSQRNNIFPLFILDDTDMILSTSSLFIPKDTIMGLYT